VWIVVSALLCLFALVGGFIVIQKDSAALLDKNAIQVNVTGQQWLWSFDYENGARSEDLYLPVDKPVVFHITSVDVKHSFWVVQMGIKMDANPGYTTDAAVTPNKIGVFDVRCAELCGLLHAYMQTKVHVVSQADYEAWLSNHAAIEKGA
jgi:cytochrome c oxidase subunit 2